MKSNCALQRWHSLFYWINLKAQIYLSQVISDILSSQMPHTRNYRQSSANNVSITYLCTMCWDVVHLNCLVMNIHYVWVMRTDECQKMNMELLKLDASKTSTTKWKCRSTGHCHPYRYTICQSGKALKVHAWLHFKAWFTGLRYWQLTSWWSGIALPDWVWTKDIDI